MTATAQFAGCLGTRDQMLFIDPVDGDMKVVTSLVTTDRVRFAIQPYPNVDDWKVLGDFDLNCQATVDFNVPGKPNPPPVNLTMTTWVMGTPDNKYTRMGLEFTDPTATLAPAPEPVNLWVLDHWGPPSESSHEEPMHGTFGNTCGFKESTLFHKNVAILHDMHDGDKKSIKVKHDGSLTLNPSGNDELWTVQSKFGDDCVATVDFNVAGKPNPPPVALEAHVWQLVSVALDDNVPDKQALLFFDPTETLGHGVLNAWVEGNVAPSQIV